MLKTYLSPKRKFLNICVAKFENGVFQTDNEALQAKIEAHPMFMRGYHHKRENPTTVLDPKSIKKEQARIRRSTGESVHVKDREPDIKELTERSPDGVNDAVVSMAKKKAKESLPTDEEINNMNTIECRNFLRDTTGEKLKGGVTKVYARNAVKKVVEDLRS
jgi:ribosomal protein S13